MLSAVLCFIWLLSQSSRGEMGKIPGSMGWPVVGESFSFLSEFSSPSGIYSFMRQRQQRYGKVFKTNVLGRFTVFMTGREAGKILLTGKDGMVSLNLFYTGKQVLGPQSLLTTSGEEHKRPWRLIAEPLSIDALKKYFQFIDDLAIRTLEGWNGRTVFVLEEASTFTLKVIGNMIMSLEPEGHEQENFHANFKIISTCFASLPFKIPGTKFHRGLEEKEWVKILRHDFLLTLVRKHSRAAEEDENSEKLTDSQLKDNILTLLVAGHDTTTAALTWLVKFLGENPDVLQKLRMDSSANDDSVCPTLVRMRRANIQLL
ncbi:hypothetical protein J5N97_012015 [Dioscorea zingiberensis]|uniref:Cytochrome P450 n=1 Tax=Dioscorea zingiberensis TaxID=325984 RepID=A0A9D5CND7_9LILI|nr:hypothetical protein J5N97_012015 [Dioscorea zingiberensis]